jgi:DNA ligase-1
MKQHFLMLAHNWTGRSVAGWFLSEKLDGQRAFWDGGISRGVPKAQIPWANCAKDSRYKKAPIATGLWSRYGNVIHAPDKWLDTLPAIPLDGELYLERGEGERQKLSRIIRTLVPDTYLWDSVRYCVFDMPSLEVVLRPRELKETNFKHVIIDTDPWVHSAELDYYPLPQTGFQSRVVLMKKWLTGLETIDLVEQRRLPYGREKALEVVMGTLDTITDMGGEGVMLRHPDSLWTPTRTKDLLKVKKLQDDEATVTGYTTGRKTDKGSKLLGKMGALVTDYRGKRFELSGFTDEERRFENIEMERWASEHPGEDCPDWINNLDFPRGSQVTFRFREHSKDGLPVEGRYWRKHVVQ